MILPSKYELDAIDMETISRDFKPCPEIEFLKEPAGTNHYRLLKWISRNYPYAKFSELGTYMGLSTLCLASDPTVLVTTYDVDFQYVKWRQRPKNVQVKHAEGLNAFNDDIISSTIIFVDTFHEGVMERMVYDYLVRNKWKGILIYDDIYYNEPMRKFWESLPGPKIDATDIGHVTGTGIIEFI